jgi:hypothetical protein
MRTSVVRSGVVSTRGTCRSCRTRGTCRSRRTRGTPGT